MIGTQYLALLALGAFALWAGLTYNRLVRLRTRVGSAWADIDVQLQRRHDLVPQLVSVVDRIAGHERATLEHVTALRAQALTTTSPGPLGALESELQQGVMRILALGEAYPELTADGNFLQLQRDLVEVEDHLQYARRFYNGAVRDLNTACLRFPDLILARLLNFREAEFFQAGREAASSVGVRFST
jgi:LemA protein